MRRNGEVTTAGGLLPFGHLGWGYRGADELDLRAAEYLADGLAQGQWVELVGEGSRAELEVRLKALPGGAEALADDRAGVTPVEEFLASAGPLLVDPEAAVGRCATAVQDALDRGFFGLRAIVDATSAVRSSEQRAAFARFEHLADQRMAVLPVSALCAYDLDDLGAAAAAELLCLHPFTGPEAPTFRLFATGEGGLAVAGELDLATRALFDETLRRLETTLNGDELVVDLGEVDYLEHNALVALDDLAERRGLALRLTSRDPALEHMVDLLSLGHLFVATDDPQIPA